MQDFFSAAGERGNHPWKAAECSQFHSRERISPWGSALPPLWNSVPSFLAVPPSPVLSLGSEPLLHFSALSLLDFLLVFGFLWWFVLVRIENVHGIAHPDSLAWFLLSCLTAPGQLEAANI